MIMSKVERQTRWGDALITNCRMVIVASMYVIISPSYRHVYILYSYSPADGYVNVEIYILCDDDDAASIVIYARNEQSKGGNKNQE